MLDVKHLAAQVLEAWQSLKTGQLNWRLQHQAEQQRLANSQQLAEHDLTAQLNKRSAELSHELAILKASHRAELIMHKTKCEQDIKDYKQYLAALDQLKMTLQSNYHQLPAVMVFTIHHHAKQLLNAMWEADSETEKVQLEMRLIQFMTTLHEEVQSDHRGGISPALPEKTLQLIQNNLLH